jgi:hypothetical protein
MVASKIRILKIKRVGKNMHSESALCLPGV